VICWCLNTLFHIGGFVFLFFLFCFIVLHCELNALKCFAPGDSEKKGRAHHFVDFFHVEERMKLKYIKSEHFFLLDLISYKMQCAYLGFNLLICLCLNTPFNIGGFAFRYFLYVFHVEQKPKLKYIKKTQLFLLNLCSYRMDCAYL